MIGDSGPWREELQKSSARLRRWSTQQRWTHRTYFLAERDIMMGAYAIRRLMDSGKTSSLLGARRYPVVQFPLTGRVPMTLDRFTPEDFYDLEKPTRGEINVARLCNQVIHSFVFQIFLAEDETTAVMFVSDRDRARRLHSISFEVISELFSYVAREDLLYREGTMRDGDEKITNISNHDLVEAGLAVYDDDDRVQITRLAAWPEASAASARR
ncbi:MAG: hypothetical protein P0Y60_04880 [Candidatus Microbacterium colombiense]|nr:MAG: hypothetical protein P0Y60_04880 [Microbacterium sp.]